MSFDITQEQQMIEETLERLLADHWDRQKSHDAQALGAMRDAIWAQLGELGLLGALLPESWGGIGGGPGESLVMARVCGRLGADLPLLSSIVLAGGALLDIEAATLPFDPEQVASGRLRLALGVLEPGRRYASDGLTLQADADGDRWLLRGVKQHVLDGASADWLVLAAALGDAPHAPTGLFLVARDHPGLRCTEYPAVGGARLAHVACDRVSLPADALVARGAAASAAIERALQRARFWAAAETLGACEAALNQTIDYLRIREQFGRRLASFQALQHRLADAYSELELLRSQVLGARIALDEDPDGERARRDLAAACAMSAEVGDLIGREAIQLHGAIGMTQELGIGRYLMRVDFLWRLLGDARYQRERLLQVLPELESL
ncbi:MAG: acyl-CoA dehydrogenase [Burkholderiaceae bacterium]